MVVDRDVGAELAADGQPVRRARRWPRTRAPSAFATWIAVRADAARSAVHEERLAGLQPGRHDDVRPHRARHLGDPGRGDEVDAVGHGQQLRRGRDDLFGAWWPGWCCRA